MSDNKTSEAASVLGRRGAGKTKNFSPEELAKRTERIQAVNAARRVAVSRGTLVRTAVVTGIVRRGDK